MADRIVYLVDEVEDFMRDDSTLEFVDDEGLNQLMMRGYEASTTMQRTVKVGSRKVPAMMMVLKPASENRGVSTRERDDGPLPGGSGSMIVADEYGEKRSVSIGQAFVEGIRALAQATRDMANHPGHLGAPKNHNMPGLTIISGEMIHKAFDLGLGAAMRGEGKEACPFPAASEPATVWLRGYNAANKVNGQKIDRVALEEAEENGFTTARSLGRDDQAHCPYQHPALKDRWKAGFVRGGGRVE